MQALEESQRAAASQALAQADAQAEVLLDLQCPACGAAFQQGFDIVLHLWIELDHWAQRMLARVHALASRYGWSEADIVKRVKAYITTRGPHGSQIHTPEKTYDIPPAHERRVTDPTGCGDAFRAGLIYGIEKGYDWLTIGRMGNLMGALKVEHPGTQNQRFDFDEFNEQFKQQFGYAL